jgi:hypothetical protein
MCAFTFQRGARQGNMNESCIEVPMHHFVTALSAGAGIAIGN